MAPKKRKTRQNKTPARRPFWQSVTAWSLMMGRRIIPVALILWLVTWLWLGGIFAKGQDWAWQKFISLTATQGLVVQDVVITGRDKTDLKSLQSAIHINPQDPILSIDMNALQRRIDDLPWVKSVTVRRTYNGMIYIDLVERIPFVLWKRPGRPVAVLDTDGEIIIGASPSEYSKLLNVSGVDAPNHVIPLMQNLIAQPDLKPYIKGAEWVGGRRWDLITIHGTLVHMPENDMGYALARLLKIHHEKQVLDQGLVSIDLRGSDRIIIETERGKAQDVMHAPDQKRSNII